MSEQILQLTSRGVEKPKVARFQRLRCCRGANLVQVQNADAPTRQAKIVGRDGVSKRIVYLDVEDIHGTWDTGYQPGNVKRFLHDLQEASKIAISSRAWPWL